MNSSSEFAVIVGLAMMAGLGAWLVDGRPSYVAVEEQLAQAELKEGEIRLEDLMKLGEEETVWVDARREDEWKADGLEGSIHVTTLSDDDIGTQLERHVDLLFGAKRMVIYCSDLNCGMSHELAELIKKKYADMVPSEVLVLHGGMTALRVAGRVRNSN